MFTFNAALSRPSFQSSVYTDTDGSVYPASLANDGHRDTSSGCSLTRRENSPWWAVDLGGPTAVVRVDLTNIAATQCGMCTYSHDTVTAELRNLECIKACLPLICVHVRLILSLDALYESALNRPPLSVMMMC